jgi:hypothetical protein
MTVALVVACTTGTAYAETAPNVCSDTGISRAIVVKYLGTGASIAYGVGYCDLRPASNDRGGIYLEVYVSSKSQFEAEASAYRSPERLTGLGPDALGFYGGNLLFDPAALAALYYAGEPSSEPTLVLLFKAGAHTALITAGGPWPKVPSESTLIALAHVVYAHLG